MTKSAVESTARRAGEQSVRTGAMRAMVALDLRLAGPAVCAWVVSGVLVGAPHQALLAALGLWTAALVLVLWAWWGARRTIASIAVCLVAAALVATAVAAREGTRTPTELVVAAEQGRYVNAQLVTQKTIIAGADRPISATLVAAGDSVMSVPVVVFGMRVTSDLGIGTTLNVGGTFVRGEAGDDAAFLFFTTKAPEVIAPPPPWLDWANVLRASFRQSAGRLPGDGGDLLPGLAIGDTNAVDDTLDADMKKSALSHLTAVSGANCAVVIALVMLVGGAAGLSRGARTVVSLAVLVLFVVLVTPEASVVRAAVMAGIVLLALLTGRPVRGLPVLSVAVLVLLTMDPWMSRSYGFVLSALATAGLLLLAGPIARRLARWMPLWLAVLIAVPTAAQLACQPVLILLQPSIPIFGIVANVLAEPAAPIATVIGLLACLGLATIPPLGELLAHVAWLPSAWIAAVARYFGGLPGSIPWLPGIAGAVLLAAATVLGLWALLVARTYRWRLRCGMLALLLLVAHLGAAVGIRAHELLTRPGDWQIAACDIGQGDAVLLRSGDATALVDTGPDPALLTDCLDDLSVDRIDLLVLTHFDHDHVGGVRAVLGRVDHTIVGPSGDASDDALVESVRASGSSIEQVSRGRTGTLGELRWQVLWPQQRLGAIEPGNSASIALMVRPEATCATRCLSALFLGDLGEHAQALLLAAGPVEPVDVVKVSHHGSADQSDRLYEKVRATVGIIGVGAENGYGHPTTRLLDLLESVGTTALRTDRQGLVLVAAGEHAGEIRVWSEREGDGGDD
ncbi:MAG: ComEC/Rec2 family competence protein [Microbacteriaceae bacterium]